MSGGYDEQEALDADCILFAEFNRFSKESGSMADVRGRTADQPLCHDLYRLSMSLAISWAARSLQGAKLGQLLMSTR